MIHRIYPRKKKQKVNNELKNISQSFTHTVHIIFHDISTYISYTSGHKTFLNSLINKSINVKTINKVNIDSKNHKVFIFAKKQNKHKTQEKKN